MLLEGKELTFKYKKEKIILNKVNIYLESREVVGLVGKSGYGKSTLAKILAGYENPISGAVLLDGKSIPKKGYNPIQLIHQHPEKAMNPMWKMKKILAEGGTLSKNVINELGIEEKWLTRYPKELSSGELQRFSIARALGNETRFLIADEITTMLDAINQAQIWNMILDIAKKRNLGLFVITHNMNLAQQICTRIVDLEKENQLND